ncbi:MAG TPA: hypothetical protein VJU58_06140 [Microbacterium sp.]|nr:hypothetical protein [Microbacterium sp.]
MIDRPTPKPTGVSSTYAALTVEQAKQAGGWEREIDGVWLPCDERGDQPDGKRWPPPVAVGGSRFKVVVPGAGAIMVKSDATLGPGEMRLEQSIDGKKWDPAGRFTAVHELAQRGEITAEQARKLLEAPTIRTTGYGHKPITVTREQLVAETKYDGLTGAECLARFERLQREGPSGVDVVNRLTLRQLGAARELWSLQLKARIAADKERERRRVTVDLEVD